MALAPRHTKEEAYKTLVRPQLEYAAPIWHSYNETQTTKVEKVQRTAARWSCRRWRNTSSVCEMLDELEWPSRRERSSLAFFYKIHSGKVSLDKDKYLTPAPNVRRTRASHESQYTRPFAYSDALKNYFSPELFRFGIVSLLQWSHPRPLHTVDFLHQSPQFWGSQIPLIFVLSQQLLQLISFSLNLLIRQVVLQPLCCF